jgi:8-oxo-dGTP diphosphatase
MREFWEFPGGKLHNGETSEAALRRELAEELGIHVDSCAYLQCTEYRYPEMHVIIDFFLVVKWTGEPTGRDGQQLDWVDARDLDAARLLPADMPVLEALKDAAAQGDFVS